MQKIYSRLFSFMLTVILVASYIYDFDSGIIFVSTILWILSILIIVIMWPISLYNFHEFDEGKLNEGLCKRLFENSGKPNISIRIYNLLITSIQITILVLAESPILAAVYFIGNLIAFFLQIGCEKRYKIWKDKQL